MVLLILTQKTIILLYFPRQGCEGGGFGVCFCLCDGVKRQGRLKISNKPGSAQSSKLQNHFNKIISGEMNGTEMK